MLAPLHWALITHVYGCFLGILRILPQHKTHKTHTEAEINAQTVLAMKEASVLCSRQHFFSGAFQQSFAASIAGAMRKANEKLKQQQKQMGVEDALAPDVQHRHVRKRHVFNVSTCIDM